MKILLSSDRFFFSLQGEGLSMGVPCLFLRLQSCNFRCVYCDTAHTWKGKGVSYDVSALAFELKALWQEKVRSEGAIPRLVITGGEPLLQQDSLSALVEALEAWDIEVETNGTVLPSDALIERAFFNCSPKLSNSQMEEEMRIVPGILETISVLPSQFKFVVENEEDILEIQSDFIDPGYVPSEKVVLMPQARTLAEMRANIKKVLPLALTEGFRVMPRFQVLLWGDRQGV